MEQVRHRQGALVVVVLLVVVNLPLLHGAWVDRQIDRDGVEVTAEVTATRDRGGDGGLVELRLDPEVDPEQQTWQAAVDREALERAEDEGTVAVRVVPGEPSRHRVAGEQGAGLLVALTVFADLVLLAALVLVLRRRPVDPDDPPG